MCSVLPGAKYSLKSKVSFYRNSFCNIVFFFYILLETYFVCCIIFLKHLNLGFSNTFKMLLVEQEVELRDPKSLFQQITLMKFKV